MASGRFLRKLIKTGVENSKEEFFRVAEEIIREERAKNHHLLANDLERILYGIHQGNGFSSCVSHDIPKDRERSLPLLEVREPLRDLKDIVVSDENKSILEEVIFEYSRSEVLASHGLKPISKLLFCGPPGCGKTLAGEVLASELSLEFVIVRFDAVVSSFLGETSSNLRKVFTFLEGGCFVGLFDEFDAIGKERNDPSEHGELKRVVNSFLQMMDGYRGKSILIAATNHEGLLDKALWRRFDEVLLFEPPNLEQIKQLFNVKLRGVHWELPIGDVSFLNKFKGFSHADIERILIRATKTMVLKGRKYLTVDLIEEAFRREEKRQNIITKI